MSQKSSFLAFLEVFGANLRRTRTARGLTQEKLAELADLNPRTVQKIEAGRLNVLITTLSRLQAAMGCPWDDLLGKPTAKKK